jgi:hypothetical protein
MRSRRETSVAISVCCLKSSSVIRSQNVNSGKSEGMLLRSVEYGHRRSSSNKAHPSKTGAVDAFTGVEELQTGLFYSLCRGGADRASGNQVDTSTHLQV